MSENTSKETGAYVHRGGMMISHKAECGHSTRVCLARRQPDGRLKWESFPVEGGESYECHEHDGNG